MTIMKIRLVLMALAAFVAVDASAQQAVTDNGRQVKKIKFDGDQVTLVYGNGSEQKDVEQVSVRYTPGVPTGVNRAEVKSGKKRSEWYTADGRLMQKAPTQKGVYVERRNGKAFKRVRR